MKEVDAATDIKDMNAEMEHVVVEDGRGGGGL